MRLRAAWLPFVDDRRIASVRMRSYRPVDALRRQGDEVRVLRGDQPEPAEVLVLQKAYSAEHLQLAAQHRAAGGAVVLDLCDNHFATPTADPVLVERAAQLNAILEHVDVVSVCTPDLGEFVPHPQVMVVNDALDPAGPAAAVRQLSSPVRRRSRVLWFGAAGAHGLPFGMRDLARILPALAAASDKHPFELVVMSNSRPAFRALQRPAGLTMRYVPWRRSSFTLVAGACDVAVLPVEINAVTRGKTSNRVATAFQNGLAVVTDPLPSYLAFGQCVRWGDYAENVPAYLKDRSMRDVDVALGQRLTRDLYSHEVLVGQWRAVLRRAQQHR